MVSADTSATRQQALNGLVLHKSSVMTDLWHLAT